MPDLLYSPAAESLADALATESADATVEPGKFGAVPFLIAGMTASGAALFAEGLLVDYAGPAAKTFIESQKGLISQFLSPKLADLASEILAEFGDQAKGS